MMPITREKADQIFKENYPKFKSVQTSNVYLNKETMEVLIYVDHRAYLIDLKEKSDEK